jgi:hypothetical protein
MGMIFILYHYREQSRNQWVKQKEGILLAQRNNFIITPQSVQQGVLLGEKIRSPLEV